MRRGCLSLAQWVVNIGPEEREAAFGPSDCEIACRIEGVGEKVGFGFPFLATQITARHDRSYFGARQPIAPTLREENVVEVRDRMVYVLDWKRLSRSATSDSDICAWPRSHDTIIERTSSSRIGDWYSRSAPQQILG